MGGTMRLGSYDCEITPGSILAGAYGTKTVQERHRHRYEFNNAYLDEFEANGMRAVGKNPQTGLVEAVEVPTHPFFLGAQFHPEYKSTVEAPAPLFVSFIAAARKYRDKKEVK